MEQVFTPAILATFLLCMRLTGHFWFEYCYKVEFSVSGCVQNLNFNEHLTPDLSCPCPVSYSVGNCVNLITILGIFSF